jgi:hypothetical protein
MRQLQPQGALQASGLLVRSYRKTLSELSLLTPLCTRLPPATARLLGDPPGAMTWSSADWVLELGAALCALANRDTCRQLGQMMTRDAIGGVLAPMARTALALFGSTPATLYPRLPTYMGMYMRGLDLDYTPTDPRGGTLLMSGSAQLNDGYLAIWEGVFLFVQEACGAKGQVRPARLEPSRLRASLSVSW